MKQAPPARGHGLAIGASLAARRNELQMPVTDVAGKLLLSQRHVEALEADDASAFYNQRFYQQALKSYTALLGLDLPVTSADTVAPPAVVLATPMDGVPSATPEPAALPTVQHRSKWALSLAAWLVLAAAAYLLLQTTSQPEAPRATPAPDTAPAMPRSPAPTPLKVPSPTPTAQPKPSPANTSTTRERPAPATTAETRHANADVGYVFEAQRLTWVFSRTVGGRESKITLKAGQRLVISEPLKYLAVGDPTALHLLVDGVTRDLRGFGGDDGAARLGPAALKALRTGDAIPPAGATPAPADASDVEIGYP